MHPSAHPSAQDSARVSAGVSVRPLGADDDLDALNAGKPDGWVTDFWRELDLHDGTIHWRVGELDGVAVGFASVLAVPAAAGGRAMALLHVLAPHRRHGVGTALLAEVEQVVREAGLPGLVVAWVEGDGAGEAAAHAWGLCEVARHRESVLHLTAVDPAAYRARATVPGVRLRALSDLGDLGDDLGDELWHRLFDFLAARFVEAPDSAGGGEPPPAAVIRPLLTDPWSLVLAADEADPDAWLGVTVVARRPGSTDVVNTFFTGVAPQARGRGIATAVKCHQALLMADAGMTRLYTQNMDGNEPILAANRTLGFVEDSGYVDVARDFGPS